jgi:hypothetical protein
VPSSTSPASQEPTGVVASPTIAPEHSATLTVKLTLSVNRCNGSTFLETGRKGFCRDRPDVWILNAFCLFKMSENRPTLNSRVASSSGR